MAKKQSVISSGSGAGAATARAPKPAVSRTRSAKHKLPSLAESTPAQSVDTIVPALDDLIPEEASAIPAEALAIPAENVPAENPHDAISRIAYGYWESRGYQGGNEVEDWLRAEEEHRQAKR